MDEGEGAARARPSDADDVRLEVPADARFARVARVAVSAVAVRLGLDVTVVEDLRIAVDESLILLLRQVPAEPPEPEDPASLVLTIHAVPDDLRIDLELQPVPPRRPVTADDRDALSRFEELVPPRVSVTDVEPAAGSVQLALAERPA